MQLHGLDRDQPERDVLARQLRQHGHATVADAVSAGDQEGDFELEYPNDVASRASRSRH